MRCARSSPTRCSSSVEFTRSVKSRVTGALMATASSGARCTPVRHHWAREGSDGTVQPILAGEIYAPLRELSLFDQVRIDPEVHTLVWPNGADFDPETLHDWPRHADAFAERARAWNTRAA